MTSAVQFYNSSPAQPEMDVIFPLGNQFGQGTRIKTDGLTWVGRIENNVKSLKVAYWIISTNYKPTTPDEFILVMSSIMYWSFDFETPQQLQSISTEGFWSDVEGARLQINVQSYFASVIAPLVKNYYNLAVIGNSQLDITVKNIVKAWWGESQSDLYEKFKALCIDNNPKAMYWNT